MATVEKRGDGWRVRWRDPDGKARSRQCPSARSARDLKLEVEEAIARGRRWAPSAAVRAPLLAELIEAFLADLLRTRERSTRDRAFWALDPFNEWVRARTRTDAPTVDVLTRALLEAFDAHQVALGNSISTRRVSMWAVRSAWRWGWSHPEWRAALTEPATPTMPRTTTARALSASWTQLDAIVHLAELEVRRLPSRVWLHRLTLLLRGFGWRVTQCLELGPHDYDRERGEMQLRPELGKSPSEKAGRTVPVAPWLRPAIEAWLDDPAVAASGRLVGARVRRGPASQLVRALWERSSAPPELYRRRPDHAFRIGLITGLAELRADREAVEHYVGHTIQGVRAHYLDPRRLPIEEVARLIPAVGPRVRGVSEAVAVVEATTEKHKR